MSEQKYPKSIGAILWLHFNLLMDVDYKVGNIVATLEELNSMSNIPYKLIMSWFSLKQDKRKT